MKNTNNNTEENIYVNENFKKNMENLGVGIVDFITIYRRDGDRHFFRAGTGKFSLTTEELHDIRLR